MASPNPAPRRLPGLFGGRPSALWYGLVFIMVIGLAQMYYLAPGGRTIPYSQFKQLVQAGSVEEVVVGEQMIRGTLKAPLEGDANQTRVFMTTRVDDPKLTEELGAKGVKYSGELLNRWLPELLSWIIPLGIIVALWAFFFRRLGGAEGGVMSFARSKAKIYADDEVKVRFTDVAGVDEAENELVVGRSRFGSVRPSAANRGRENVPPAPVETLRVWCRHSRPLVARPRLKLCRLYRRFDVLHENSTAYRPCPRDSGNSAGSWNQVLTG